MINDFSLLDWVDRCDSTISQETGVRYLILRVYRASYGGPIFSAIFSSPSMSIFLTICSFHINPLLVWQRVSSTSGVKNCHNWLPLTIGWIIKKKLFVAVSILF